MPYLSLVIPSYNEEKILESSLQKVITYLGSKKFTWEIIVVDDGSTDKTKEIVKKFTKNKVRLVSLAINQGKGAALKAGVLNSKGDLIVFTDCDLSISINHLDIMIEKLSKDYPVVIGSRRIKGSQIVVHQPFLREKMGQVFTLFSKLISGVNLPDFTCGFKGFRKEAALKIFSKSLIKRWAYDTEIIFLANKMGLRIGQVPVLWKNRKDTRVRLGSAVLTSFLDLLRIKYNNITGKYEKNRK